MPFKPGDMVFHGKKSVVILKQVLNNIPAYRVRGAVAGTGGSSKQIIEYVVDGCFLSADADGADLGAALAAMAERARPAADRPDVTSGRDSDGDRAAAFTSSSLDDDDGH